MGTKNIFIIAEIGHNHNGNISLAKAMIKEAKHCGVDAVKFQLYDINKIWKPYQARYSELAAAQLSKDEVKELAKYSKKIDIEFMASAFDPEKVAWLEEVGVKRHKLASRSIKDKETIQAMEATGKPIIASLGMWKFGEDTISNADKKSFLFCVAEYPAIITNEIFPQDFHFFKGFSDHTIGMEWCMEAVKRGATIIEKHFTLDHTLPGYNQKLSANPQEMQDFVSWCRNYERE